MLKAKRNSTGIVVEQAVWIIGCSEKRGFRNRNVLGALQSHGALAEIRMPNLP